MEQIPIYKCTVCPSVDLRSSLTFGKQPPSNRFLPPEAGKIPPEDFYLLSLGYCQQCGTIQLVDRMPKEVTRPRYDWLVYNEPESHLDEVVNKVVDLSGINKSSRFLGITYKDKSTLERIERLGFFQTSCVSENDLNCSGKPFGLETIQDILSKDANVLRLKEVYGGADVILARHIIEHASNASKLIGSLRGLLAPNGYMVFELPDSEKIFRANNHAFIWEEHISYFTAKSLARLARIVGAELAWSRQFPYRYENSLVAVFQFSETKESSVESTLPDHEDCALVLEKFAKDLHTSRDEWRMELEAHRANGENVAVFGAGHLTAKFINFYDLGNLIDCVIDDHPKKVGLLMPGSGLEIVASEELLSRGIKVCVSTLSPESEVKVRRKLSSFFNAGGRFVPAFSIV